MNQCLALKINDDDDDDEDGATNFKSKETEFGEVKNLPAQCNRVM